MALCCPTPASFSLEGGRRSAGPGLTGVKIFHLLCSSLRDGDHTLLFTY